MLLALGVFLAVGSGARVPPVGLLAGGVVVALPMAWSWRRTPPPTWTLWAFLTAAGALLALAPRVADLVILILLGTLLATTRLPDRPALWFACASLALALAAGLWQWLTLGGSHNLTTAATAYAVGYGVSVIRRQRTRHQWETERLLENLAEEHRRLEAVHARLAAQTHDLARLAATEERNRIAREIHDVLAHALTAIIVQAEAAAVRLGTDPPTAADQVQTVAHLARQALQEARLSVSAIRAEPGTAGLDVLRRLCQDAGRWANLDCTFTVTGSERPLPAAVALAAYRILQESLTNARRHGQAGRVDVSVALASAHLTLTVVDGGPAGESGGTAQAAPSAGSGGTDPVPGSGLRGMRERAEALGGSLEAGRGPDGHGFRVRAVLPLAAEEPEPVRAGSTEEGGAP